MKSIWKLGGATFVVIGIGLALGSCGRPEAPSAEPGYRVYVTNERSGDLSVIDGASRQVVSTIPLGKRPRGVRLGPDGQTLYIALTGSPIAGPGVDESKLPPPDKSADGIAVFDIASGKVRRIIKGVNNPEQLAVSKAGRLYAADEDAGKLIVLDIVSGAPVGAVPVGEEPEGVALTPDEKQVWVTSEGNSAVAAIDTTTLKVLATIPVGERPRNVVFSADGSRAFVAGEGNRVITVIDVAGLKVLNTTTLADATLKPMGLAVSGDGKTLYVSQGRGGQVLALDAETLAARGAAVTAGRPWGIALSPDSKLLFSAGGSSDDVAVTDTATMKVLAKIKTGAGPWTVVVVPGSK
jgi:YVTN family beta-propeller protein